MDFATPSVLMVPRIPKAGCCQCLNAQGESQLCWPSKPDILEAHLSLPEPDVKLGPLVPWEEPLQLWLSSHSWVTYPKQWVLNIPISTLSHRGFSFISLVVESFFC